MEPARPGQRYLVAVSRHEDIRLRLLQYCHVESIRCTCSVPSSKGGADLIRITKDLVPVDGFVLKRPGAKELFKISSQTFY